MSSDRPCPEKRIVTQHMLPDGVLTVYEDGTELMLPYNVNEDGDYVELFPNAHLDVQEN